MHPRQHRVRLRIAHNPLLASVPRPAPPPAPPPPASPQTAQSPAAPKSQTERLHRLVAAAHQKLAEGVEVEALLDANPVLQELGDLGRMTELLWLDRMFPDDVLAKQCCRREVERLKREVAGPSPTPLETLLAGQVAGCWISARHASVTLACSQAEGPAVVAWRARYAESSERRLLSAIRTLAQVRKLMTGLKIEITHKTAPAPRPPSRPRRRRRSRPRAIPISRARCRTGSRSFSRPPRGARRWWGRLVNRIPSMVVDKSNFVTTRFSTDRGIQTDPIKRSFCRPP